MTVSGVGGGTALRALRGARDFMPVHCWRVESGEETNTPANILHHLPLAPVIQRQCPSVTVEYRIIRLRKYIFFTSMRLVHFITPHICYCPGYSLLLRQISPPLLRFSS